MTFAILKSDSLIGMEIDALAPILEAEGDTRTEPALRAIEDVYTKAVRAADAAARSQELTPLGQREAVKKALAHAVEALRPHASVAERLAATAAETRAQALQTPSPSGAGRTLGAELVAALEAREIRDRLAGRDALEVNVVYQEALGRADWPTVTAIESAPVAFALLTADMRAAGEDAKLARSPLAAQLLAENVAHRRQAGIVASVRTHLAALAQQYGVDPADVADVN